LTVCRKRKAVARAKSFFPGLTSGDNSPIVTIGIGHSPSSFLTKPQLGELRGVCFFLSKISVIENVGELETKFDKVL
jgi:hypothetical protein